MRVVVLRSRDAGPREDSNPEYAQVLNTAFARRVLGNLVNAPGSCTACQDDCTGCRRRYRREPEDVIAAVVDLPAVLPYLLESPASYVPDSVPRHDVLLALCIHDQILLEVLEASPRWGTRAVVVPLEAPDWTTPATRRQAEQICEEHGIEVAFPKPFCALEPARGTVLADFRRRFRVGMPDVTVDVEDGVVTAARVNVSAACGATYYIARWLEGRGVEDDLKYDVVSRRLHSYPCTASMEWDDEIGDTPLHVSGQAHYRILDAIEAGTAEQQEYVRSPVGIVIPKPMPVHENVRKVEEARQVVLEELRRAGAVPLERLRRCKGIEPAALSSALLELKREGAIRIDGSTIRSLGSD